MYACKVCNCDLATVRSFIQHCRIHSNLPKLRLPCCFRNCYKTSSSLIGLKVHISRDHSKHGQRQSTVNMHETNVKLRCSVPSCIVECVDRTDLVKHLRQHIKEGIKIGCPIKGCTKKYHNQSSFSCHLSRDHSEWTTADIKYIVPINDTEPTRTVTEASDACDLSVLVEDECIELNDDTSGAEPPAVRRDDFIRNFSLFFARLSTQQLIPDSTVDVIVSELQNINVLNQAYLRQDITRHLRAAGASEDLIVSAMNALKSGNLIEECLQAGGILHSKARRATYVKNNFAFVEPQSIYTGVSSRNKNCYCYYIPIKESITALLKDFTVLKQVKQCVSLRQSADGILRDFIDGSVYKQATRDTSKKYISLILYQDSFEIVNPLGSAKKRHKVLGVYFVLGNLQCHYRSVVDHTQLVMLINEGDFDRVGQRIFSRLVADLQTLENEGIVIGDECYYVVLAAVAGDNLGSHCIGGFVKNFSSTQHICRFCLLTRKEMNAGCMLATSDQIRNPSSYDAAVLELASSDDVIVDGIKFRSIFNDLQLFHVCNPGLPPCIAHDLFEGVVAYDLPIFLRYFVKKKFITVDVMNKRIECFPLLGSDSNVRPALLSKKLDRLSGSASQNWCLLRLIPLLLHNAVDSADEVYQAMLLMRRMVEFIAAPAVSLGQVACMKVTVEDYLERRHYLFPDIKLRPKHHYLSHYASLTFKFGPLIRLWTLRFESKHQYFKRCVRNSHNFVNVTKMLANRHQMFQAYLSAGLRYPLDDIQVNSSVDLDLSLCSGKVRELVSSLNISHLQVSKEVTLKGTLYTKGLVLPVHIQHDTNEITFGQIQLIIISSCVHFIVALRHGEFNFDAGCYVIADESDLKCLPLDSFADHYPLAVYETNEFSAVILRHQLLDATID